MRAPIDVGRMAELRRHAALPRAYDPEKHRSGYHYVKEALPGDYFQIFKKNNLELDPMMGLLCAGRKEEIGDKIQMCIGVQLIHIVIYKGATRKAIEILFKKVKHHIKNLPGTLSLAELDKGVIFDSAEVRRRTAIDMATTIFQLLKKRRRYLRLVMEQSHSGGALQEDWMHQPGALAKIALSK
jgi:hypothetical protein